MDDALGDEREHEVVRNGIGLEVRVRRLVSLSGVVGVMGAPHPPSFHGDQPAAAMDYAAAWRRARSSRPWSPRRARNDRSSPAIGYRFWGARLSLWAADANRGN